jgi:hypothetical protein
MQRSALMQHTRRLQWEAFRIDDLVCPFLLKSVRFAAPLRLHLQRISLLLSNLAGQRCWHACCLLECDAPTLGGGNFS